MTSSEQARADAIADAETLRLYTDPRPRLKDQRCQRLCDAEFYGKRAVLDMDEHRAYYDGKGAARAAFRAVPGLRGE